MSNFCPTYGTGILQEDLLNDYRLIRIIQFREER